MTSPDSITAAAPVLAATPALRHGAAESEPALHAVKRDVDEARAPNAKPSDDTAVAPPRDARSLQYQVDPATQRIVVTIVDEASNTVNRQIPDAELMRIAESIDRMQGFLIEDRA